ncbi:MAG: ABC transporter ATP-binding protein [Clostridia bacterium]|nr:ABC transporter ATP-binding protein [Clostridia bacterium]MBR2417896.1 ABC transporter ATP-binding protein [Clostridia bacterium]
MLNVSSVTKKFGKITANDNISFKVDKGEIAVLLGPNGAGKSTIIKCITGLLRFSGEITLDGYKNKSLEAKSIIGYIPEMPAVYDMLTVGEHLEFILRAYRMDDDGYGDELLTRFEMLDKKNKLGKELSKGMQQKLSICCALVHKPEIVIFDEPMVGLDPHAIKQLKEIFLELKNKGASVLISTHMLDSVEDFWDTAYIMAKGKLVAEKKSTDTDGETLEELFFRITESGEAK